MSNINKIGETNTNTYGTEMKIIAYRKTSDIDVEFQDEYHYVKNTTYSNFIKGWVKNPYDKSLYNVGYMGVGKYTSTVNNVMTREYKIWAGLLQRCYLDEDMFPTYYMKCTVCDEWHNFQNFAKWLDDNKYPVNERLHIDKDILNPKSHIYSPETCLLVPQRINMLFTNKPNNRGLPNGINKTLSGRYMAKYNGTDLGAYDTLDEAYSIYAKEKERVIKRVADEYINIIPKKVYDALYAYKVDIRNDKNYQIA